MATTKTLANLFGVINSGLISTTVSINNGYSSRYPPTHTRESFSIYCLIGADAGLLIALGRTEIAEFGLIQAQEALLTAR